MKLARRACPGFSLALILQSAAMASPNHSADFVHPARYFAPGPSPGRGFDHVFRQPAVRLGGVQGMGTPTLVAAAGTPEYHCRAGRFRVPSTRSLPGGGAWSDLAFDHSQVPRTPIVWRSASSTASFDVIRCNSLHDSASVDEGGRAADVVHFQAVETPGGDFLAWWTRRMAQRLRAAIPAKALITASMALLSFSGTPWTDTTGSMTRTSDALPIHGPLEFGQRGLVQDEPLLSAVATLRGRSCLLFHSSRPSYSAGWISKWPGDGRKPPVKFRLSSSRFQ